MYMDVLYAAGAGCAGAAIYKDVMSGIVFHTPTVGALGLGGGAPEEDHECTLAGAAIIENNS
jgi:uncharacterized protein GlcG (DUF336 family)